MYECTLQSLLLVLLLVLTGARGAVDVSQEERREMDQTARFEVGSTAKTRVRLPVALNSDSIDSDTTHKKKRPKC